MKIKNKFTNLLKTVVFLFGISLLLWNCETENEITSPVSKLNITKVNASHFLNNYNVQSKLKERNNYVESSRRNNDELNELLDFTVVGDYAKFVEEENYHSYTFPIIRENPIDGIQENFFLSLQPDGTYKEFLVWYYLDEETFVELENNLSLLVGKKMKMIDLDLLQEENNTASRSDFGDLVDALPDGCYEAFLCGCDEGGGYGVREIPCPNNGGQVSGNVGAPGTSTASGPSSSNSNGGGTGGNGANEPAQLDNTTSPISSIQSQLNSILEAGDYYVFDSPTITQSFTNGDEFKTFLNDESFDIVGNEVFQNGNHRTKFKVNYSGTLSSLDINIISKLEILQINQSYELVEVISHKSGLWIFADWEQSSTNYTVTNTFATIRIDGYLIYGIEIEGIGLTYYDNVSYIIEMNKTTGTAISIRRI